MLEYIIIYGYKTKNRISNPYVLMGVRSENGFKRILDFENFINNSGGVSEITEEYTKDMQIVLIRNNRNIKIDLV